MDETMIDPIALALELVAFDTVSPPGTEEACAAHLAALLVQAGFDVTRHAFAPGRTSLIARLPGTDPERATLVFTGHLDTVPLGLRTWSFNPHGEIRDGRLYGRGASDMKAGVAAFVTAAIDTARAGRPKRDIVLVITAGEETGCLGAAALTQNGALGEASGLVIAEPTANRLALAHKGALHLRAHTSGATAHGSMPHLGDNAVLKAARAVEALQAFRFGVPAHPLLGSPTATVTSLHGGEAVNVIPDSCTLTFDLRTLPGQDHEAVLAALRDCLGPDLQFDPPLADMPAVGTEPSEAFAVMAIRTVHEASGGVSEAPIGMPYFTDGSVLQGAYGGCPTIILGPGEPGQAHQTDEWCETQAITEAKRIYSALIANWCGA
jgi:succinyl-diaminopimelate desuccinylase